MVDSDPTPYALYDPNAPPQYDNLFPPRYTALCLQVAVSITHSTYTPPESFPLDPPLPYSAYSSIAQSESDDSDVFPQTLGIILMMQIWTGISDPSPQPPSSSIISFVYLLKLKKKVWLN